MNCERWDRCGFSAPTSWLPKARLFASLIVVSATNQVKARFPLFHSVLAAFALALPVTSLFDVVCAKRSLVPLAGCESPSGTPVDRAHGIHRALWFPPLAIGFDRAGPAAHRSDLKSFRAVVAATALSGPVRKSRLSLNTSRVSGSAGFSQTVTRHLLPPA